MVKPTRHGSYLVGDLPEGCRLCTLGAKLVLFVTGRCGRKCYYCPLSPERKGVDGTYANERPVNRDEDIIEEARLMDALGTGLTGGDPLIVPDRTLKLLSMLKSEFGADHHIHLYTASSSVPTSLLSRLSKTGLNELRFHASKRHGKVLSKAVSTGLKVGVEIPSIPGTAREMKEVALMADSCGASFLNLNELEMCETTSEAFGKRGLKVVGDNSMAIGGSIEEALGVAEFCEAKTSLDVHVCPSGLKDSVQLKNRLGRRAKRVRKPYESIDEDNLLVKAVVTPLDQLSRLEMESLARELRKNLDLDIEMLEFNEEKGRLETLPELAEDICGMVEGRDVAVAITEEYPTWDRFETERIPISR
jgi:pyruvate formate-lyase activating enzyme-like uncharacterized protein